MQTGQVVESGDARQVLDAPQHPYTKRLKASVLAVNTLDPSNTLRA